MNRQMLSVTAAVILAGGLSGGCESLPGSSEQQGTVIGGATGAATGAVVAGEDHRLAGAVIGGLLGAGGGYLIGTQVDKVEDDDYEAAREAGEVARRDPATAAEARNADTADLNDDGFVTLDEVVAMEEVGLTDVQILDRLEETGQVFQLTEEQEEYLLDRGVSRYVITRMPEVNVEAREALASRGDQVIGEPRR